MKEKLPLLPFIALLLLVSSCASYKKQYSKSVKGWERATPSPSLKLSHTMYLVGDAGNASRKFDPPILRYLKTKLPTESKNSSILFLGDNIYEYGMPPEEDSLARKAAEYAITAQLEILNDFKGHPM